MSDFNTIWNDGYVVQVRRTDARGYMRYYPLRKFHEQGDAICFRDTDCPKLTDTNIRALIKQYNPKKEYKRISGRKFIDWDKWVDKLYQEELTKTWN